MIFGRNHQGQVPGTPGSTPDGSAAGTPSAWTAAGYPVQPSGTGYAGYTPGTGGQGSAGAWGQSGYAQQGMGYAQTGSGYSQQGTGYAQTGSGYAQQGTGYAQTGSGYTQPGAGYAQPGAGYAQPGAGYAQPGTGYAQQGAGYAQPGNGYTQPGAGYAQPGAGYAQPGSGYTQPGAGYAQGQGGAARQGGYAYPQMNVPQGYGAQSGYTAGQAGGYQAQGYSAFAQMGRNQTPSQDPGSQIPLNGGGYVPPAVPVRRQPFVMKTWMLIALGAGLAVLFAAGMFIPGAGALLWVFIALSAAAIAVFFVRPMISANQRLCFTVVFGVLSLLALVNALGLLTPRTDTARNQTAGASVTAQPGGNTGAVVDPETGNTISSVVRTEAPPTATPAVEDNSTTERLESFFRYWSANRQDEMLTLCAPSWQSSVDNPKTALFGLMANRTPLDYTVEKISGVSEDTSRTVTVTSTMDRNNGKEPVKYRLNVLMVREGDQWYVDPQSLKSNEPVETENPDDAATPSPSPTPAVNGGTVLYYNPDGGTKYHLDPNCKSTHEKFLPFKGHFTYAEVNDEPYASLSPCNVCAAPLREQ